MIFQQLSIALGVISLIGFFASSGKQKKISAFLLGLSLLMGIISFTALSPYSQPPLGRSESQQEQVVSPSTTPTPSPIPEIDRGFSRPPSDTTVLKDTGVISLENGDYMVVFSFLGNPKNGDVTYQSILFTFPDGSTQRVNARGKETHPLNWTKGGKVEVVFFPDSEDKTSGHYIYLKRKGEQAELPYLLKVGN